MTHVEWGGILGIYSSGKKTTSKAGKQPLETTYAAPYNTGVDNFSSFDYFCFSERETSRAPETAHGPKLFLRQRKMLRFAVVHLFYFLSNGIC